MYSLNLKSGKIEMCSIKSVYTLDSMKKAKLVHVCISPN